MITVEELRKRLDYDPETGLFTRREARNRWKAGDVVGGTNRRDGYLRIGLMDRLYSAHRLAWLHFYGEWPKLELDHINGVRDDNRIANLRDVPHQWNRHNVVKAMSYSVSGLVGVARDHGRWRAAIHIDGKKQYLGMFATPEEAHAAYMQAKPIFHPGFVPGRIPVEVPHD